MKKKIFALSMCLFLVVASIVFTAVTEEEAGDYLVLYTIKNETTGEVL